MLLSRFFFSFFFLLFLEEAAFFLSFFFFLDLSYSLKQAYRKVITDMLILELPSSFLSPELELPIAPSSLAICD